MLTLLTALSLATVAAWFSIVGITSIFSGAYVASIIMGAVIESGKLVGISWLYRNWKGGPWIKWPLASMTLVAMLITSIGIFGFLSKAHLQQGAPIDVNKSQIQLLEQKIERENQKIIRYQTDINDYKVVINQMDDQVQKLIDNNKVSDPKKGAKIVRESQKQEREQLSKNIELRNNDIDTSQQVIATLKEQQLTLSQQISNVQLEFGPITYIAALLYDDPDKHTETAIRMMILIIMFTFDPLAVFLLMAANHSIMNTIPNKQQTTKQPVYLDSEQQLLDTLQTELSTEKDTDLPQILNNQYHHDDDYFIDIINKQPQPTIEPTIEPTKHKKQKDVHQFGVPSNLNHAQKDQPKIHQFGVPSKRQPFNWNNPTHKIEELLSHYTTLKNKQTDGYQLSKEEKQELEAIKPILQRHGYNIYI